MSTSTDTYPLCALPISEDLKEALEALKSEMAKAEVKLGTRRVRGTLHPTESVRSVDVQFNGHAGLPSYNAHCQALYEQVEIMLDGVIAQLSEPKEMLPLLDLMAFELRSCRKKYFPKKRKEDWQLKITTKRKYHPHELEEESVKQALYGYLKIQLQWVEQTRDLFKHRIGFIETYPLN